MPDPQQSLVQLGLTQLEADIYRFLLSESPATGYRIAQGLGKPTANVYNALETLRAKSALLVREGESRLFSPVPVDELLERLQRDFERHVDSAREALQRLPGPAEDDGVYHLRGRDAVLDRCRAMLASAQTKVLVDAFPLSLEKLRGEIEGCVGRGIQVGVKCYAPTTMEGVAPMLGPDHEEVRGRWPVEWLAINVDAVELLIAVFDDQGQEVLEAIWTRNPWIAFLLEGSLAHELAFTAVRSKQRSPEELEVAIRHGDSPFATNTPGRERLMRLLGLSEKLESKS